MKHKCFPTILQMGHYAGQHKHVLRQLLNNTYAPNNMPFLEGNTTIYQSRYMHLNHVQAILMVTQAFSQATQPFPTHLPQGRFTIATQPRQGSSTHSPQGKGHPLINTSISLRNTTLVGNSTHLSQRKQLWKTQPFFENDCLLSSWIKSIQDENGDGMNV